MNDPDYVEWRMHMHTMPLAITALLCLLISVASCGLLEQYKEEQDSQGKPSEWASEVVDIHYGDDAGFGQNDFPDVVLGPPGGGGTQTSSLDVLSLGVGGSITLGFGSDSCIMDGEGDDVTILENVFYIMGEEDNRFIETARVAASQDGEHFVEFPAQVDTAVPLGDPRRYSGFAGVEPVLEGDTPDAVGGDRFDLDHVGLAWARYVRIQDTGGDPWDPGDEFGLGYWQAGFDLDAAGAIHPGSGSQCE